MPAGKQQPSRQSLAVKQAQQSIRFLRSRRHRLIKIDRREIIAHHFAALCTLVRGSLAHEIRQRISEMMLLLQGNRALHHSVCARPRRRRGNNNRLRIVCIVPFRIDIDCGTLLEETRVIPIIFTYVFDPVGSGFVRNFAQPGGNVTGFQTFEPTIVGKWLQMLLEVAPSVRRIGFIYDPETVPPGTLARFRNVCSLGSCQVGPGACS